MNVTRGSIQLKASNRKGTVKIGITKFPTFPMKGVHTLIRLHGDSKIIFGEKVQILPGCSLVATYGGNIETGSDIVMNMHSLIYCNNRIKIGNHVSIGWYAQIYDSSVHYMLDVNTGLVHNHKTNVIISNNVWIANHATIAPGAKIPEFCIVAAHTLVNKDFMDYNGIGGLLVGQPAKYKETGKVRLLNDAVEYELKSDKFNEDSKSVSISDLGYSVNPFDGDYNILYKR